MGKVSSVIVPAAKVCLGYADLLLKDINPADFARKPKGIDTNHPAFCYGHLAVYPDRLLEMVGRPELAAPDQQFVDMFSAGKECIDDPTNAKHPPMEAIVARFRQRHAAVLPVIAETPDEVFERPNPNEKMRDRLPTIGVTALFLLGPHLMIHLGQVSAWRRCMGLGGVM